MVYVITAIGLLSVFDLCATMEWITRYGAGMEANPLMRALWVEGPGIFALVKVICTVLFCFTAFILRNNRLMKALVWLPFTAYIITAILHIAII